MFSNNNHKSSAHQNFSEAAVSVARLYKDVMKIEEETTVGGKKAIVPSIEGWAKVTGLNTIFIDDDDPYSRGFQVS